MAQKVSVQLVSDVSGKDIKEGEGETITFGLDGTQYEIDVTLKEGDALRGAFQDYIAAGRKLGKSSGGKRASSTKSSGSGRSKEELTEIRAWAQQNGHEVSERGRIKQEVLDAYDAAS